MKAAALRGALSDRARAGRVRVVDGFLAEGAEPSTKAAVAVLEALTESRNVLVVLERSDEASAKSLRNLELVHVLRADQLNTYDVLLADDVIFTRGALAAFLLRPTGRGAKAVATSGEAAALEEEK
jgi:large subunit ribosomal protein L4